MSDVAAPSRLAEVLGATSIATDLADGYRTEQATRTAVLAVALARAHGFDEATVTDVYWAALLRFLGCTAFASEETFYGAGDDIGLRRTMGEIDGGSPGAAIRQVVTGVGKSRPLGKRVVGVANLLRPSAVPRHHAAQCEAGQHLGALLGLGERIVEALGQVFCRWDGKGWPALGGEELSPIARVVAVAEQVALHADRYDAAAAMATAAQRSGGWFEPALVITLRGSCTELVERLAAKGASFWDEYLDAEPGPPARLTDAGLDKACQAFARYADLKSGWRLGHSTGVAELAAQVGEAADLDTATRKSLVRAALLHDLGVVGVPNAVWDKRGSLNRAEREQVRLHSYHTERILARSPLLDPIMRVASAAHERPDGSGYHRGLPSAVLAEPARLLAACDAFHAMQQERPHRPAMTQSEAACALADEAGAGRFDLAAVRRVLEVAGERAPRPEPPAGLTEREVEVLLLVARGGTNKDVARALGITPKTVAHHVAHVYGKIGCSSRAGAALFAVDHGLLGRQSAT